MNFRQTPVLERVLGSAARKSIQGVFSTQAVSAPALALQRAFRALSPPMEAPHFKVSM